MRWADVCLSHPEQWVVAEALEAHTEDHRRVIDRLAVLEACLDGAAAWRRYRELQREHPGRELYYVHTGNAELDIEERPWVGIRGSDAARAAG